jgi:acyl dehydratase
MAPSRNDDSEQGDDELLQQPRPPITRCTLTPKDLALYALSVGADPVAHSSNSGGDLSLVYERHPRFGRALPGLAIVVAHDAVSAMGRDAMRARVPGYSQERALHGEHYLRLERPMTAAVVASSSSSEDCGSSSCHYETSAARVVAVAPKSGGEAAVVVLRTETWRRRRQGRRQPVLVAVNEFTSFVLGAGLAPNAKPWVAPGAIGRRASEAVAANDPPPSAPDLTARFTVPTSAAALYRLNGDLNPLHIDPLAVPSRFGGRPILHGLATLGMSLLLLARSAGLDPTSAREVKCRFSAHVYPGDEIVVEAWRQQGEEEEEEGDGRLRFVFRTRVERRGGSGEEESAVAISQAAVSFFTDEEMRRFDREDQQEEQQALRSRL